MKSSYFKCQFKDCYFWVLPDLLKCTVYIYVNGYNDKKKEQKRQIGRLRLKIGSTLVKHSYGMILNNIHVSVFKNNKISIIFNDFKVITVNF